MKNLNKLTIFLLILSMLFSCNYGNVNSGEVGLLRNGSTNTIEKESYSEGRYHLGLRDDMIVYSVQWKPYVEKLEVITRDDLTIEAIASITIRPIRSKVYNLHNEIGSNYYATVVRQDFRAAIKNAFKEYPMTQVSKNFENIEKDIRNAINQKLASKYLEIDDINIDDINYNKTLMDAIQNKLAKEQEVETMKYELNIEKKKNEMERLKAQRDAEIRLIAAKAEAEALSMVNSQITTKYIQLKAMENPANKVIYLPIGKDGLPMILNMNIKEEKTIPIPYKKGEQPSKFEVAPVE